MKLLLCGIAVVTLVLILGGLVAQLSVGSLGGSAQLTRETGAVGLINVDDKLAIALALVCVFFGAQRRQWRWVSALLLTGVATLFAGALSALTGTGPLIYFAAPLVAATLALAYALRTPDLTPARV